MIRAIWLATICLAVLSTLAVGRALMTRNPSSAPESTDQTTIGTDLNQDTLGKADRLEITYVRQEVPATTVLWPIQPVVPAVASVPPSVENKIISRHWRDPSAIKPKQAKQTGSGKKGKIVNRKGNQAADRSKLRKAG